MASMQNPNLQQTYEDFKPLMEEKDTPDALLLLFHLPGFSKEHVGASFEADTRKIRVFGEKPLDINKRKRFKEEYVIPETCDSDKLKGKFEGTVITITMPKKPISSVEEAAQEAAKQVTPPTSKTSGVEEATTGESEKPQKDKEEIPQKGIKEEEKHRDEMEAKDASTPEKAKGESRMSQKDQEEIPQKGIKEEEKHRDEMEAKDASTPEKAKGESRMSQKDQEGTPQKGKKLEDEKHKENKKAEKTSEAGKEPQKAQTLAREASKDKGRSGMKTPEKRKKESDEFPIAKGIKDIANSASQAITKLADRVREEDKQKLLYAGAAILMVAVGIYASFKLRAPGRQ